MTTKAKQINEAKQLGLQAFSAGIICAPAQDSKLMKMLVGRQIGKTPEGEAKSIKIMEAWRSGWFTARISTK